MTELFRSEMKAALSEHRLVAGSGWMDDRGRVEYECQCGHRMYETPRTGIYQGGETMLASHQADVLGELGFHRAEDDFDRFALERLFTTLQRRRAELGDLQSTIGWAMSTPERNRLNGAHAELESIEALIQSLVQARVRHGDVELPLEDRRLAVA